MKEKAIGHRNKKSNMESF